MSERRQMATSRNNSYAVIIGRALHDSGALDTNGDGAEAHAECQLASQNGALNLRTRTQSH